MKRMLHRFVVLSFPFLFSILMVSTSVALPVGDLAYDYTAQILKFGPRPPGSKGIEKVRKWIGSKVKKLGFALAVDQFIGKTPIGDLEMQNLSFQIPGSKKQEIVLAAHYDSKKFDK